MELNFSGGQISIETPDCPLYVGVVKEWVATIEHETVIDWQAIVDVFADPDPDWPEFL